MSTFLGMKVYKLDRVCKRTSAECFWRCIERQEKTNQKECRCFLVEEHFTENFIDLGCFHISRTDMQTLDYNSS